MSRTTDTEFRIVLFIRLETITLSPQGSMPMAMLGCSGTLGLVASSTRQMRLTVIGRRFALKITAV